ncbi:MAG: class I adenylate-forming enzyme family protein [Candidatus Zixiibacteriota bacterium]
MRLFDILTRGAALAPDNDAVVHGDRRIRYRELLVATAKLAEFLKQQDIAPGERVAVLYDNSIEYVIAFFAVTRAGYVVVPLDISLKPDKFKFILDDSEARILLIQPKFTRYIDTILGENSPVRLVISERKLDLTKLDLRTALLGEILDKDQSSLTYEKLIEGIEETAPLQNLTHKNYPPTPHELAAIFYTSGSTGAPKGVMLSHRNLVSNTIATVEYLKLTGEDIIMVILPFYYIYGNSLLLTHLLVGGRLVIDNRFAFPQVILETMVKEKTTGLSGVPSNFMILLNFEGFRSDKLPNLRYLTQAGGAMAPKIIQNVINVFPDREIYIMYGQTEASPRVTWLPPEQLKNNIGSIGIPVPGVTVTLTDDDGNEVAPGKTGEITVSGDNVMLGYWHQAEEEEEVLRGGRLFTGDLAYRDEKGFLFVVSRKKEIIKVGGNRVSAKEIEERILENEKVLEAAVVAVSDDVLGEAIKAVLVLKPGQSAHDKEIQDYIGAKLARHKIPKYVVFTRELPKYPSGKVKKKELSQTV